MRMFVIAAVSVAALALSAAIGSAAEMTFKTEMTAALETPPTTSSGTGEVTATYDPATKMLNWTITYSGLTGPATAAHFHGPAKAGEKAPPVVPIKGDLASPIKGTATLTDQQAKDLQAGLWYFNVHTAKFPNGEIRGQLTAQ
jgi:Cu/Zn superoxide dismutase